MRLDACVSSTPRLGHSPASSLQELSGLGASSGQLFVPDERGVLTPAGKLVFNDVPWLGPQQEAAHLVHPKISFEVRRREGGGGVLPSRVECWIRTGWM